MFFLDFNTCCWFREFETSDIDLTADGAFMFGFFISSASPLQQAFYEKAWAYLTQGGRHAQNSFQNCNRERKKVL